MARSQAPGTSIDNGAWSGPPDFPQPVGVTTPPNEFTPEPAPVSDWKMRIEPRQRPDYVAMLSSLIDVLNARLLLLLALVAVCGMAGYAVYQPLELRSWTVGGFALVVLWPLVWLNKR